MLNLRPALKAIGLCVLLFATTARGDNGSPPSDESSSEHHWRIAAMAGVGSANRQTYFLVGGMVGYEWAYGFTPNVEGQWWTGATPGLFRLAPGLTWYAPLPVIRPYVGLFYAHWFVGSGFSDQNAIGGRAGLQIASAGPMTVNAGIAYERLLSCSDPCDSWWPEITAGMRF